MWFNPIMNLILYSPIHSLLSKNTLVLQYTGRKSGKSYATPVNYVSDGRDLLVVSFKQRTWWRNLIGGAPVTLRLQGKDVPAKAEPVFDDEKAIERDLGIYLEAFSGLARNLGVRMDDQGHPNPEDLAKAAKPRVMVRIHLAEATVRLH